ncbi:hypothetical protein OIV83_002263 [Microbotryomycetes sp. JL201]|nr:hypothetical protein OIV83_002263 [Microbotryomycetes sp. JL201]
MIKRAASVFVGVFVPRGTSSPAPSSPTKSSCAVEVGDDTPAHSKPNDLNSPTVTSSVHEAQTMDREPSDLDHNAGHDKHTRRAVDGLSTDKRLGIVMSDSTKPNAPSPSHGDDGSAGVTRVRLKLVQHSSTEPAPQRPDEHDGKPQPTTRPTDSQRLAPVTVHMTTQASSVTCHHDKTRSERPKMHCSTLNCNTIWCQRCLEKHYFTDGQVFVANTSFMCPRCRGTCMCAKCKDRRGEKRALVTHKRPAAARPSNSNPVAAQTSSSSSSSDRALYRPTHAAVFERPQTRRRSGIVTLAPRRLANTVWDVNDEDEESREASDMDDSDHGSQWSRPDHKTMFEHDTQQGARSRRRVSEHGSMGPMQPSRRSNRQRRTTWHRMDSDEWGMWGARNGSREARGSVGNAANHSWTFMHDEHQSDLGVTDESDIEDDKFGFPRSGGAADLVEPVWSTAESFGAPGTALEDFEQLSYEPIIDFGSQHFDDDDPVFAMHVEQGSLLGDEASQTKKRGVVWREGPERRKRRLESLDSAPSASASPSELEASTSTTENSPAPVVGSPPPYSAIENMATPPETAALAESLTSIATGPALGCLGGGSLGSRSSSYIDLDRYTDAEIGSLVRRALTLGQDMFAATSQLVAKGAARSAGLTQNGASDAHQQPDESNDAAATTASKLEFRNPFLPTAQTDAHFGVSDPATRGQGDDTDETSPKLEDSGALDDSWVLRDDVKFDEDESAQTVATEPWAADSALVQ